MPLRPFALPVLALSVAACAGTPASPPLAGGCNADAIRHYVGQVATPEVVDSARKAAGAGLARALKPNQPATMDYRADRINVMLDDDGRIVRATCG
jgi:hypothetical protein